MAESVKNKGGNLSSHVSHNCKNESRRSVSVAVPATSANMGGGFDCVGVALNIWNELTLEISDKFSFHIEGEGENELPMDASNLVIKGVACAYKILKKDMPTNIKYVCKNRIPHARGLGSSSAAIVSGLLGGLLLANYDNISNSNNNSFLPSYVNNKNNHSNCDDTACYSSQTDNKRTEEKECRENNTTKGKEEEEEEGKMNEILFNLAADIEGHPDNVAPAVYGGMQIGFCVQDKKKEEKSLSVNNNGCDNFDKEESKKWFASRVKIASNLKCLVFVPDSTLETSKARCILPKSIERKDAIFNISRVALLINLMNNDNNNLSLLKYAVEDSLHQPYRLVQNPHMQPIIDAAVNAGAYGAYLSGAGPSILVFIDARGEGGTGGGRIHSTANQDVKTKRCEKKICDAILNAAESVNVKGRIFVTYPTETGAHIIRTDPPLSNNNIQFFTGLSGIRPL